MRLTVRFTASLAAVAFLALSFGVRAQAQSTASPTAGNGTYIAIDPLANVRYDNRFDLSLGLAYDHMKAGPELHQGANLGGLDLSGSYWFAKHWAAEGSGRYYLGTSGAAPNHYSIDGPFVSEFFFAAGPEWLGPHNKHGALSAHALFGGVYGNFQQDLRGQAPSVVGFYNNQVAPAAIIGGHMDLNRSPHWVFRVNPDAVITRYSTNYASSVYVPAGRFTDVNFAISVGIEYKFQKKR
ncbi:MAG: hypothetical protein ABR906_00120 [Terracidiphilus sp.]|jgi:hypothetical protein